MTTFKANKIYSTRSTCDHNCIFSFRVVKRTAKRITLRDMSDGKEFVRGISVWHDAETCMPFGSYSMAPVLTARDN